MKAILITLGLVLTQIDCEGRPHPTPSPSPSKVSSPAGIILLMGGQLDPAKPLGSHPALAHANIDGMRIKTKWLSVEATEGAYSWTPIDQAFALAKSLGKKIGISINAGADDCPAWLYDDGAKKHIIVNGKNAGAVMPVIDDPVYLAKWTRFVAAFGARYDSNPTLAYVVMTGIGYVVEWYEADSSYFQSLSPPNPPGTAKWIHQAETIITAYMTAFPTTQPFGALANPYGGGDGLDAEKTVINFAVTKYPGRFGLMTNTLSARSSLNFYPCFAINQYHQGQPTGFQMLWAVSRDGGIRDGYDGIHPDPNALNESLDNGVSIGGRFAEVYEIDCENPNLQATITTHQALFKKN